MSMVLHMMRIIVMAKKDPCTERMEENFITMDGLHWLHLAQAKKTSQSPRVVAEHRKMFNWSSTRPNLELHSNR
jgi:serine acetyltransferase